MSHGPHADASDPFQKRTAVAIALFTTVLAFANMLTNQARTEAILSSNRATNKWSHFQSKSTKQQLVRLEQSLLARLPSSDAAAVDPEEAFVASLSSCHLLWFLDIACRAGWVVDDYRDEASGVLARNPDGRAAMTLVTLRPQVRFGGDHQPDAAEIHQLHEQAHAACFIANSVKTELRCEPVILPS